MGAASPGRYKPFHFGGSLRPDEVEISDEMFVITAEEAKKHVEPPRLTTVIVTPAQTVVEPGKKQSFAAKGLDQHGRDIDAGTATWTATGGAIDREGVFTAGPDEGNFLVTAATGTVRGTAGVTVAEPGVTPPINPPVKETTGLAWEGDIPPQKWMNFYTKVLSKFAASKGLTLTVRFELSADSAVSQQKIEETKVALRELGLRDDINVS